MLALLLSVGSASVMADPPIIPKAQAARFCQLFLYDGHNIMPLSHHARRLMKPNSRLLPADSSQLTSEQMFATYVLYQDNWRSLRLFPHLATDGTVSWYAPADNIPESVGEEHQKYIREVLPRLKAEVQAGHWQAVDAYIDKMIEYQCQFGGKSCNTSGNPTLFLIIGALLLLGYLFFRTFAVGLRNRI